MSTSNHRFRSDRSYTKSPVREYDSGSSTEARTESDSGEISSTHSQEIEESITPDSIENDSNEDLSSHSPVNDAWLLMAYAKHRLMVSLLKDVYNIFNTQWNADLRSRAGSQTAGTGTSSQHSCSRTPSSANKGKRKIQDGDSDSPDANEEKRRRTNAEAIKDSGQGRLYACCFHKYNAHKYCSNTDTGTKYRSCAGPGFSKISQLK